MRELTHGTALETLHPLWEQQVALERSMMREGGDHFQDTVIKARQREQMSSLAPLRGLIEDWLPEIVGGLKEWLKLWAKGGGATGPRPQSLPPLMILDPYVSCWIAVRRVLDSFTGNMPYVTALSCAIGRAVEQEMQVRAWEAKEPDLFYAQQKKFTQQKSTDVHQRRVNINRFNALMAAGQFGFAWDPWDNVMHFRVGIDLLKNIQRTTQWFDMVSDPTVAPTRGKSPPIIVMARPKLVEWLGRMIDKQEARSATFKPTIMPPKPWDGTRVGGYYTPYIPTPRLIRFKASQQTQRERAADEYEALDMPEVYEALHFLQETPWRINARVLQVVEQIVVKDMGIAGVPLSAERPRPPRPATYISDPKAIVNDRWMNVSKEDRRDWHRKAANVHRHNAENLSHRRETSRVFRIAHEYKDYDKLYFPHMLDFRGRAYPIPVGLQPQGTDLSRGLLEFAEGKPIETPQAAGWLAIQLASMWGWDKLSHEDRINKVYEHEELWARIDADPLHNLEWTKADKPLQALAAIYDWTALQRVGYGHVSHTPVTVDGTCNGIQHLAAMTRDAVAGAHVNLTPSDRPQDIYQHVANLVEEELERLEDHEVHGELARYWLSLLGRTVPRSLLKRPVMVLPYGGTMEAYRKYTKLWLDENYPTPDDAPDDEFVMRWKRVNFITKLMWDAVSRTVRPAMGVMKWLRDCATVAAKGNQPIFWPTASGFMVRHFYGVQKARQVETMLDGQRMQLQLAVTTKDLDIQAQLLGISPNFIHSQDAATMVLSINKAKRDGITAITAVHDAFGTHACDMPKLEEHLREAFIEVHEGEPLATFRQACLKVMVPEMVTRLGIDPFEAAERAAALLPPLPDVGTLDLGLVRESSYFFS